MPRFCLALDASQVNQFLACPESWNLAYQQKIQHKGRDRKALDKGQVIHHLLEIYYRERYNGKKWDEAGLIATKSLTNFVHEYNLSAEEFRFLSTRFSVYTTYWNSMGDFTVLSRNGKPAIELGFSIPLLDNSNFYFVLEGRIDFIANYQGTEVLVDHKTQSRKANLYSHSTQFLTYCLACNCNRILINYIGLQENFKITEHFRRSLIYFSPDKITQWRNRLITIFYKVTHALLSRQFEKNESNCSGKFGICCEFSEICRENLSPYVVKKKIEENYEQRKEWHPWE